MLISDQLLSAQTHQIVNTFLPQYFQTQKIKQEW